MIEWEPLTEIYPLPEALIPLAASLCRLSWMSK